MEHQPRHMAMDRWHLDRNERTRQRLKWLTAIGKWGRNAMLTRWHFGIALREGRNTAPA